MPLCPAILIDDHAFPKMFDRSRGTVRLPKAAELRNHAPQQLTWSIVHVVQVLLLLFSTYSSGGSVKSMIQTS